MNNVDRQNKKGWEISVKYLLQTDLFYAKPFWTIRGEKAVA